MITVYGVWLNAIYLLLMCRNTIEIYDYFSVTIFTGGVILNGEGTATDTHDILSNKGE